MSFRNQKGLKTVGIFAAAAVVILSVLLYIVVMSGRTVSGRSWSQGTANETEETKTREISETKINEIREISGINKIKEGNAGKTGKTQAQEEETAGEAQAQESGEPAGETQAQEEKTAGETQAQEEETAGETQAQESGEPAGETQAQEEETAGEAQVQETEGPVSELQTEDNRLTVAIDPGHQGSWVNMSDLEPLGPGSTEMKAKASTGTMGRYSGKPEYELNLEISMLLRDELEARGYRVILTRENNDTAISNMERATMAWEEGGDIYVRIHANGSDNEGVQGALAMVPSPDNPYVSYLAEDSYLLGQCILDAYCGRTSFGSLGVQYYDDMTGINWSQIPVMILEMGFMTNQSDDLRMADTAVQTEMAAGIADGIDRYFTEKGMKTVQTAAEQQEQQTGENDGMEQIRKEILSASEAEGSEMWAVSLEDLNTHAVTGINEEAQMSAEGVVKLFLMAAIYDRICYPETEERHIFFNEAYEGELKEKITKMIVEGDQAASQELLTRLGQGDEQNGMAVVNQFCEENGYTGTVMKSGFSGEASSGENLTTAYDCRKLLADIYQGTCVGQEASAKMFAYLKNQAYRDKIPQGIADTGAQVSNQAGEFSGEDGSCVENDAAVIEADGKAWVLCVLGEDLSDEESGKEKIREISRIVYENLIP